MKAAALSGFTISSTVFLGLKAACVLGALAQMVIEPNYTNFWAVACVVVSVLFTLEYLQRSDAFDDSPVSSLSLLGLSVTTQWMSLIGQTFSERGLIDNLRVPLITFGALMGVQMLALVFHWIYRSLASTQNMRRALSRSVLGPIGAFRPLAPASVWIMGLIGAASLATGGAESGNAGGKIFEALLFLAWMPALIPIWYAQHGKAYCDMKKQWPLLLAFVGLLFMIAMARNARQFMVTLPLQLTLVALIFAFRSRQLMTSKMATWLGAAVLLAAGGVHVARDLATAMVVVRENRATLSQMQMITETFAALGDRGKLELFRDKSETEASFAEYDENYLQNPLVARFSETKFHDNVFSSLLRLSATERDEIAQMSIEQVFTILPQPMLNALGIRIDKDELKFSMGDYYRALIEGDDILGGFATGSVWADSAATFGYWAPLVCGLWFMLVFVIIDAMTMDLNGRLVIAPVAVCSMWNLFIYGLSGDSIMAKVSFVVRTFPQSMIMYCVLAFLLGLVFRSPLWSVPAGRVSAQAVGNRLA